MMTGQLKINAKFLVVSFNEHGCLACDVNLTPIVYGRFTLTTVMVKRPSSIVIYF